MADLLMEIEAQILGQRHLLRNKTWVSSARSATVLRESKASATPCLNEMSILVAALPAWR